MTSTSSSSTSSPKESLVEKLRRPAVSFAVGLLLGGLVMGEVKQALMGTAGLSSTNSHCLTSGKSSSHIRASSSASDSLSSLYPSPPWTDLPLPILSIPECNPGVAEEWPSFMEVLYDSETDKGPSSLTVGITTHLYFTVYQKYFAPLRDRSIKMLEIGIGCGQRFVGASIPVWKKYLPCVDLTMFEYDVACAENYRAQIDNLVTGDQANPQDLAKAIAVGPYHVIVDDGGHTMRQQITSLRVLFPTLPPGGIYVLEDLETSIMGAPGYLDMPGGPTVTTHKFIADVIEQLHRRKSSDTCMEGSGEVARLALNVDCIREACVFVRNSEKAEE